MHDDEDLWQRVSETVEKIDRSRVRHTQTAHVPTTKPNIKKNNRPDSTTAQQTRVSNPIKSNRDVDAATMRRIKNGQIPIGAVLDLHGLSQDQAHIRVQSFIKNAVLNGERLVLIITGKGKGILKRALPLWLEEQSNAPHILKLMPAPHNKGGEGAFLLYLRRQR